MNVVVVGATSSVGQRLVPLLRAEGHEVLGTGCAKGADWQVDLTDRASIGALAGAVAAWTGVVDALVLLAGVHPGKRLEDYGEGEVERTLAVNFTGPVALVQAMLPRLRWGALVLAVTSSAGRGGGPDPIYAASKAALEAFVRSFASWSGPRARALALAPSLIEGSGMWARMDAERRAHRVRQSPTGRLLKVDEVVGVIAQILYSPAWENASGQVIPLGPGEVNRG